MNRTALPRRIAASLLLASCASLPAVVGAFELHDDLSAPPAFTTNGCPASIVWTDAVVGGVIDLDAVAVRRVREDRGLSLFELCTMPRARLDRAIYRASHPKGDQPDEAAKQRERERASDDGRVRADGMIRALNQRVAISRLDGLQNAGIRPAGWTALGPGNSGGRTRAILTDPADPNHLLLGAVAGGIWRSLDGGASWQPVDDFLPNLAVSTLVRDPVNPQRVYAGTGEGFYNGDAIRGFGIFRSTDGGVTWNQMPGTVPDTNVPPNSPGVLPSADFFWVNRIAVHPTNPDIVLAATTGTYWCGAGGIWRTTNATSANPTWTRVHPRGAGDVRFEPGNGNNVIVGEIRHFSASCAGDGGGVAYSTDAGATFTRVPLDTFTKGRVEVAWGAATPGLVLAVTEGNGGSGGSGRLWVSANGGQTFSLNSQPGHLSGQGWYDNALFVDPVDSTRVVIGGLDIWRGGGPASWWTTNTPLTWTKISNGTAVHSDNHAIVPAANYNGTSNRVVYIGNDGGIFKSGDIASHDGVNFSANWTNLNNALQITQFYSGAGRSGYPGGVTRIVGGTQDNGSLKAPASGQNWATFYGGDGGWSAVDPADPNVYYGEYVFASIHRASTGGSSSNICGGPNPILEGLAGFFGCAANATSEANFIAPFVLDPNNPNSLYVGAKSLWRSTNAKAAQPDWFVVKAPSPAASNYISAIAVAPGNPNLVWVGHNNGEVYCTVNGTASAPAWTQVALAPTRVVLRIMVDPANGNRVFVTYGGFNGGNVIELTDASQVCVPAPTVTQRHGNLPQAPVRSIVRHATKPGWLYVGTEVGVYASTDGGASWSTSNDGPGSVAVDELFWLDAATLVAATHGRSMFGASIDAGTLALAQATLSVPEGGGAIATLAVSRTNGSAGSVGIGYATVPGTGVAGVNFVATAGTLAWADGDTADKTIGVPILNDNLPAGNKTFSVTLSAPTGGAALGTPATALVTIQDAGQRVPLKYRDYDGGGKGDLLWQSSTTQSAIWLMNGLSYSTYAVVNTDPNWTVTTTGDFDGDDRTDLVWRNGATGQTAVWLMHGLAPSSSAIVLGDASWRVTGAADLDGDFRKDLLWRNTVTGQTAAWLMNGLAPKSSSVLLADPNWTLVASADFNGDGRADLVWRNAATGQTAIWLMNGLVASASAVILSDPAWSVIATGDFDGNGRADLVWRNATTGQTAIWLMNGLSTSASAIVLSDPAWRVTATPDVNGDGRSDLLWRNTTTGQTAVWTMNGLAATGSALLSSDPNWSVVYTTDTNGDGKTDLVWRHAVTGQHVVWLMNGLTYSSYAVVLGDPNWQVQVPGGGP